MAKKIKIYKTTVCDMNDVELAYPFISLDQDGFQAECNSCCALFDIVEAHDECVLDRKNMMGMEPRYAAVHIPKCAICKAANGDQIIGEIFRKDGEE